MNFFYTALQLRYDKEIVPIKVEILRKLQSTMDSGIDAMVKFAQYMQNLQRRGGVTKIWPKEFCWKFMFEPSKAKASPRMRRDRSHSQSPAVSSMRRKKNRRSRLRNKLSSKLSKKSSKRKPKTSSQTHVIFNYKQKMTMDADFEVCGTILYIYIYIYIHIYTQYFCLFCSFVAMGTTI